MTRDVALPRLRQATVDDAAALAEITISTFTETFGHLYVADDLQTYLAKFSVDYYCQQQLTEPGRAVWFAIVPDNAGIKRVAGFVSAGRCLLPVDRLESAAGEVKQLYLRAEFQNLKLGTRLLDTALAWLAAQNYAPIYIGVWSENYGAQRFYGRYGFSKMGEYDFPVGTHLDREFILKR
jgi:ribosomal protein S18 acetylase RimI-like enzyme